MTYLITGSAGFIGFHLTKKLIENNCNVIGVDNINDYYDPNLKVAREKKLRDLSDLNDSEYKFFKCNLEDYLSLEPKIVVNLAAQAGVRYSITNPSAYIQSNIVGFGNILELCKKNCVDNLIYASSSSVYGGNKIFPFRETQGVDHPISLYAASKRSNELMAHTYSHLYDLPTTGLRFFTVYGPWGRPDMALFLFTDAIMKNKPINIFNNGKMTRDFTYVDDIIESIFRLCSNPSQANKTFDFENPNPSMSWCPFRIFNIGNSKPVDLMDYIKAIESEVGVESIKNFLPMQPGDVSSTYADTSYLRKEIDFKPNTSVEVGVSNFVKWYRDYYEI